MLTFFRPLAVNLQQTVQKKKKKKQEKERKACQKHYFPFYSHSIILSLPLIQEAQLSVTDEGGGLQTLHSNETRGFLQ